MAVFVFFGLIAIATGVFVWYHFYSNETRREELLDKYRDPVVVKKIVSRTIWEGETAEQLMDSLGQSDDTDYVATKSRGTEVWKYGRIGRNRYTLRITLEQGVVVRWESG